MPETSRVLRTARLTLRPFEETDAEAVLPILQSEEVSRTYMLPDCSRREDALRLFEAIRALSHDARHFTLAVCLDGRPIGWVNDVADDGQTIELGYVIDPCWKGRGFATEALRAAIAELFARGYHAVRASFFEENLASCRVMEKSGMHRIAHTQDETYRGVVHHCIYYEIRHEDDESGCRE